MADLKLYDIIDLEPLRRYILTNGERRSYRRRQHFCTLSRPAQEIGLVISGGFAFSRPDYKGDRHILSLAFTDEIIGAYITPDFSRRSGFDITAMCDSEAAVVSLDAMTDYIDRELPGFRLQFTTAIATSFMLRGIAYRCESPESRYLELLRRLPHINGQMSNTAIASYLGIARETFVRMRSRLNAQIRDSDQNGDTDQSF